MTESLLAGYAEILYQDHHVVVLNKSTGISVIPERRPTEGVLSLRERLEGALGEKVLVVHRIDRDTSGVVVFCRTAEMHRKFSMQFEQRHVHKTYVAVVQGQLKASLKLDAPLRQFGSGRMGVHPKGKASLTEVTVIETLRDATLVKVTPHTGRRHQIRVHLYDCGHPVMGDRLYGQDRPVGGVERLMLHAEALTLQYPDDQSFRVSAPVSADWERIFSQFR